MYVVTWCMILSIKNRASTRDSLKTRIVHYTVVNLEAINLRSKTLSWQIAAHDERRKKGLDSQALLM